MSAGTIASPSTVGSNVRQATMNSLATSAPIPTAIASTSHSKPVRRLSDELGDGAEYQ